MRLTCILLLSATVAFVAVEARNLRNKGQKEHRKTPLPTDKPDSDLTEENMKRKCKHHRDELTRAEQEACSALGFSKPTKKELKHREHMHKKEHELLEQELKEMQGEEAFERIQKKIGKTNKRMPEAVAEEDESLATNSGVADLLFEGDMVLEEEAIEEFLNPDKAVVEAFKKEEEAAGHNRNKRNVIDFGVYPTRKWQSTTISYRFHHDDEAWRNKIRQAIDEMEYHTCLRWVENGPDADYMAFEANNTGCWAQVSRWNGGMRRINIQTPGCTGIGTIMHEIMHSLGTYHEHSRNDRDNYVTVINETVVSGKTHNFDKKSATLTNHEPFAYDYGSAMHYGEAFFSKNGSATLIAKDPEYQKTIGSRIDVSFFDIKEINAAYCPHNCSKMTGCFMNGYPDPNNCGKCKCVEGLADGSTNCLEIQPSTGSTATHSCGGILDATTEWQTVSRKNFGLHEDCYWRIRSPLHDDIKLEVRFTKWRWPCWTRNCRSFVSVMKDLASYNGTTLPRHCCGAPEAFTVQAPAEAWVFSRIDDFIWSSAEFEFQYRFVDSPPQCEYDSPSWQWSRFSHCPYMMQGPIMTYYDALDPRGYWPPN